MSDQLEKIPIDEMRRSIRDKIMKTYNYTACMVKEDENATQDILKAFIVLDKAYEMLSRIDSKQWKFTKKMQKYKELHKALNTAINLPYARMTEYELFYINDLMDAFNEQWSKFVQYLYYAINNSFMEVETSKRNLLCELLCISVVCGCSHQSLHYLLKVSVPSINKAWYGADDLTRLVYEECTQKSAKDLSLEQVKGVADARNALVNQYRLLRV